MGETADTKTLQSLSLSAYRRLGRLRLHVCDSGRSITLEAEPGRILRVGRSAINDFVIDDEHISNQHFELALDHRGVRLRDLDSRNGVFLGDTRVREIWLSPGTRFRAGRITLELVATEQVDVELSASHSFEGLYGTSLVMRALFNHLERLSSRADALTVFIAGETGTGKGLVARALHARSSRSKRPFVVLDCTNIPRELAESTLFGHVKGAFTGAVETRDGCFAAANGGTLFIDEIGDLPRELQGKLLRVLQEGTYCRVGETQERKVDVRVLCATHRDLQKMVSTEEFREDLFYRINASRPVLIPPLRERGDDVLHLADRHLRGRAGPRVSLGSDARAALRAYDWPGNVRELYSTLEYAACTCEQGVIRGDDLGLKPPKREANELRELYRLPVKEAAKRFEKLYYTNLVATASTKAKAARAAGLSDEGLRQALKRNQLDE